MEVNEQHGFLEEVFGVRRDINWESAINNNNPTTPQQLQMSELFFSNEFGFDYNNMFDRIQIPSSTNNNNNIVDLQTNSLENLHSLNNNIYIEAYEDQLYPLMCTAMGEEEELGILGDEIQSLETQVLSCKTEPENTHSLFNIGKVNCKPKKMQGQPSKNLMAERRRRKRLNDRLSMLRSIVPKISKMDRTSILGDTIDYMKELLERIESLRREIESGSGQSTAEIGLFKEVKPNEVLIRGSPKFDVDKRNVDTRIEICCAGKPGLLYSTVTTLEALGLEIQQCVISCFNEFAMQASCTEDLKKRTLTGPEEVKQALFRNAGYGGRCL